MAATSTRVSLGLNRRFYVRPMHVFFVYVSVLKLAESAGSESDDVGPRVQVAELGKCR